MRKKYSLDIEIPGGVTCEVENAILKCKKRRC